MPLGVAWHCYKSKYISFDLCAFPIVVRGIKMSPNGVTLIVFSDVVEMFSKSFKKFAFGLAYILFAAGSTF